MILEVGPGNSTIFDPSVYYNWFGVDKNYTGEQIEFREKIWGKNYPKDRMFNGGWENLSDVFDVNMFDFVILYNKHCTVNKKLKI